MKRKAIFLDRDGTINEDIGDLFKTPDLEFIPGAIKAMKMLQEKYLLFIITNQVGIGKGSFTEEEFIKFNRQFLDILKSKGINIQELYYCPHKPEDGCICRKPKNHYIEIARQKYNLDLKESFIIGDHPSDVETGKYANMTGIFLLTGHGKKHLHEIKENGKCLIMDNLYSAALHIVGKEKKLQIKNLL
jgi:D-glycero-D-manno-heptose 1,7-bisphosphate phosphatase